nr:unnamed protein product [Callosobruchus analis]
MVKTLENTIEDMRAA